MNADYYSPHPRTRLERPLALVGFPGAGVRAVARGLTAVTGLPLNDIERTLEARAGRSRTRVWFEDGAASLRDLEAELAQRALERRPPGVIALTSSSLLDAGPRDRLRRESLLVYLERPLPFLLEAVRASAPGAIPEFAVSAPRSVADLLPSFRARERDYLRAEVRFRCEELHPHRIVDELVAALGLLPPTESPLPGRDEVRPVRPM